MQGINFIGPESMTSDDQIKKYLLDNPHLPKPYCKTDLLSKHLSNASYFDSIDLTKQELTNQKTGETFRCISYYTEEQIEAAICSKEEFGYLVTISMSFVRRLVKISSRLEKILPYRETALENFSLSESQEELKSDRELDALLNNNTKVLASEVLSIVKNWPLPLNNKKHDLGGYTIFYDLIRLIWLHEWAHAIFGHITITNEMLGMSKFLEFSKDRVNKDNYNQIPFPRNHVLQAIELHADSFAVIYCVRNILSGYDPIKAIAGNDLNLIDRLVLFNFACCTFTVIWALAESIYNPLEKTQKLMIVENTTHPPAALRYDRFRNFLNELTHYYCEEENIEQNLVASINVYSLRFTQITGKINSNYRDILSPLQSFFARTPNQKYAFEYERHIEKVGVFLEPQFLKNGFISNTPN